MVNEGTFSTICAQMNAAFDVNGLVEFIGWYPEKCIRSGDVYLVLCPIHRDEVFRTMVLNPRNNTYHCKHVNCIGNRPSDFLDLLVKVRNKPLAQVIQEAVKHFGADYFRLSQRQLQLIEEQVSKER